MNFSAYSASIQALGVANASIFAGMSIAIQILGGFLFTGILASNAGALIGQIALIIFMIAVTYFGNNALANPNQLENMMKNIAILGGLLMA